MTKEREEAIKYFQGKIEWAKQKCYPYISKGEVEIFETAIEALEQEPKTGHWIHFASSDDCSECGWSTGKYISPSKYCPNCGAKMKEGE